MPVFYLNCTFSAIPIIGFNFIFHYEILFGVFKNYKIPKCFIIVITYKYFKFNTCIAYILCKWLQILINSNYFKKYFGLK